MIDKIIYEAFFTNLIKGAKSDCNKIVEKLINQGITVDQIYTQLFQRALYQVGTYWEENKISVATEHMATALTESLMIRLQPHLFSTERTGHKTVIACVAKEYHQVGAKMIADIFEMNGWDGYFVGANTPTSDLLQFIDEQKPDLIGLSLSLYFNLPELSKTIDMIRNSFSNIPILVGGQAFRWGGVEVAEAKNNVTYISGIDTLHKFINT
jgi:methanogenic corrinoid protein MtbC1